MALEEQEEGDDDYLMGKKKNKEGKKIAKWLNSLGITAFVLKYRMPSDEIMKEVMEITKNEGERVEEIKKLKEKI